MKPNINIIGVGETGIKIAKSIPEFDNATVNYTFVGYIKFATELRKELNKWLVERNASESDINSTYKYIDLTDFTNPGGPKYVYKRVLECCSEFTQTNEKDYTIIVTGLGGSTGIGASLALLDLCNKHRAKESSFTNKTTLICSLPFEFEGNRKRQTACDVIPKLEHLCHRSYILDFSTLNLKGNYTVLEAFNEENQALTELTLRVCKKVILRHYD